MRTVLAGLGLAVLATVPVVAQREVAVAAPVTAGDYRALDPARLADTRPGAATADGQGAGTGIVAAGATLEVVVAGRGGVPADATTAVVNVTATGATGPGYVTAWPCGSARPLASSLNFSAGRDVANAVVARLGSGKLCLYAGAAATHLVVDVNGSFDGSSGYRGLQPGRLADTRPGAATADGQGAGTGIVAAGATLEVVVAGRGGVPADATTAVVNVTATGATGPGYVTAWPCGSARPLASSLNFSAGRDVANAVVARLGSGKLCLYAGAAATHLVVDVNGSFEASTSYRSLQPARLADTRPGTSTTDGQFAGRDQLAAGTVFSLLVTERGGVPADAGAVALTVTSTGARGSGFVTVYPCGSDRPLASSLNFAVGQDVANTVISPVGTGDRVCLYAGGSATQLIVDVVGWFPGGDASGGSPVSPGTSCSDRPSLVVGQFVDISPAGVQLGNGRFGVNDVQFAASDPCVLYAAIDQAGLYKSVNGGASWRKVGILDSPLHVRVNPRDPNHLYAVQGVRGATLGFWVSRDGGETWTMPPAFQSGSSLWTTDVSMVEVNPSDFNHLLITFHAYQWSNNNNGDTGVVESTDGGVTFTPHFQPGWGHGLWPMFVGDDPDHWLLGTSDHGYWRTTNGGASWTQVVVGDSMAHSGTQLYRSKANGALYMGTWNGILRSTDNGASWTKLGGDNGITYCSYYSVFGDGTTMFTQCAYTGTNARGREEPYLVSPENDGLNWAPYRGGAQTFINGPTWQTYDATNNILYSSNGSAGILAVKTR